MASICCSPPESVPPFWPARSLRRGKSAKTCSTFSAITAGPHPATHLQVLVDGQFREDPAALRSEGDAFTDGSCAGVLEMSFSP